MRKMKAWFKKHEETFALIGASIAGGLAWTAIIFCKQYFR